MKQSASISAALLAGIYCTIFVILNEVGLPEHTQMDIWQGVMVCGLPSEDVTYDNLIGVANGAMEAAFAHATS